jgi:hypothetical protein
LIQIKLLQYHPFSIKIDRRKFSQVEGAKVAHWCGPKVTQLENIPEMGQYFWAHLKLFKDGENLFAK